MRMRTLRMWYGLLLISIARRVKKVARQAGEWGKVECRKLIAWGEDLTPRWNRELFHRCYLAETEIHLGTKIFRGHIDVIFQEFSGKESRLVIKLKERVEGGGEFKLSGYGAPVFIKESGDDCVWTGCDDGYIAIYFKRPTKCKKK